MQARIAIPDLDRFVTDASHTGLLTGEIDFPPIGTRIPARSGVFRLFTPDGVLHDHNRYRARGTVVMAQRCTGSGEHYLERTADDPHTPDLLTVLQAPARGPQEQGAA